jgi:hypothetical protein
MPQSPRGWASPLGVPSVHNFVQTKSPTASPRFRGSIREIGDMPRLLTCLDGVLNGRQSCQQFIPGRANSIIAPMMVRPIPMAPIRTSIISVTVGAPVIARRIISGTRIIVGPVKHRHWNRESDKPPGLGRLRRQHPKGENHTQDQKPLFHNCMIRQPDST